MIWYFVGRVCRYLAYRLHGWVGACYSLLQTSRREVCEDQTDGCQDNSKWRGDKGIGAGVDRCWVCPQLGERQSTTVSGSLVLNLALVTLVSHLLSEIDRKGAS